MFRTCRPFRRQTPLVVRRPWSGFVAPAYRWTDPSSDHVPFGIHASFGLRLDGAGSPRRQAESRSMSTDESFTSRCSPPRLTATQLRSVTRLRPNLDEDLHLADAEHLQAHIGVGRTDWTRFPLPPNRTGGFPASGSPVDGFTPEGVDTPPDGPLPGRSTHGPQRTRWANADDPVLGRDRRDAHVAAECSADAYAPSRPHP